ncbi:hypothetical protein [Mucilaginibacter auburnensis]|uniref:Uncharacterized protein n=1 Tax=Mucilaginibacter auburnensis TaxID=1457233 RepID=A0A2H9VS44_9SPHI|nr:hypothetical protein [Mucilaginibacter auburnensis]PJJ83638.1 hypothetical protein CLV57_0624 [Mucilaginibacter auburnensis]
MKKKNIFGKLYLKYTNRVKYKEYKWEIANNKNLNFSARVNSSGRLNSLSKIKAITAHTTELNLVHGGHAGDIIYTLPTIKRLWELTQTKINLFLKTDRPANLPNYATHPGGGIMLNSKMASMLIPLIEQQNYINSCEVYTGQPVDIDLDYFRAGLIPQDRGNIAHWCGYILGVNPKLYESWITVKQDLATSDYILINRSLRYQNTSISYKFLSQYQSLKFIGVKEEYEAMKVDLPEIEWLQVPDFLQLAELIKGCKFFIGNQSFPFSLAEGLKVPRILELPFDVINVIPEGENGFDFLFQDHFESLVEQIVNGEY